MAEPTTCPTPFQLGTSHWWGRLELPIVSECDLSSEAPAFGSPSHLNQLFSYISTGLGPSCSGRCHFKNPSILEDSEFEKSPNSPFGSGQTMSFRNGWGVTSRTGIKEPSIFRDTGGCRVKNHQVKTSKRRLRLSHKKACHVRPVLQAASLGSQNRFLEYQKRFWKL